MYYHAPRNEQTEVTRNRITPIPTLAVYYWLHAKQLADTI